MALNNEGLPNFTVYMHVNKINNKKYIGITSKEPKERWHGGNGYYRNQHFYRAIQKYGWDNFEHIILYEGLYKEEAIEIEKRLIKEYNAINRDYGYNIGLGGEGFNSLPQESKERIRQANIGRKVSDETRRKISESRIGEKNWRYGIKLSEEQKEKLRQSHLGKHISNEQKELITEARGYITFQYDMTGNFISSFRSAGEASRILGIHASGIKACCEGRCLSNHNYIFRFERDGYKYGEKLPDIEVAKANVSKNKFNIYQCDLDGNIIQMFASCTEASKELHIDRHDISKCLKGLKEKAGGYTWKKAS